VILTVPAGEASASTSALVWIRFAPPITHGARPAATRLASEAAPSRVRATPVMRIG
jgi:hypothetical protein